MKRYKLICLLIIPLVLTFTFLLFKTKSKKYFDGNTHLYKGQCLAENHQVSLLKLSERASWLNTEQYVHTIIKDKVETMINDAEKEGFCLVVTSGYRSSEKQRSLWEKSNFSDLVAPPNCSEHQTGLAVDLQACPMKDGKRDDSVERLELKNSFEELPEYQWMVKNAGKYGFEESFTKENEKITGYPVETWHWKFIIE